MQGDAKKGKQKHSHEETGIAKGKCEPRKKADIRNEGEACIKKVESQLFQEIIEQKLHFEDNESVL